MYVSVDWGRSSIKGKAMGNQVLFPNVHAKEVRDVDLNFDEYQAEEYLRIQFEGEEYMVGDLAVKQGTLPVHSTNDEDLFSPETRMKIMTAIAYLVKDTEEKVIDLAVNLPANIYRDKGSIISTFLNVGESINIDIYDHKKKEYKDANFTIKRVLVKPQGFFALMDLLLDDSGQPKPELKKKFAQLNIAIDIGKCSTDIYVLDSFKERTFEPVTAIPGMKYAYSAIKRGIKDRFSIGVQEYEVENYVKTMEFKGKPIDDIVGSAYNSLANAIETDIRNELEYFNLADNFFLAGGGATPLKNYFTSFETTIIPNPQFANANGGLKWIRRKFK